MEEKEILILNDDGNNIVYQEIVRKDGNVVRSEIEFAEQEIAKIEENIAIENSRIEELKAKIVFNKQIIAIADAKKLAEQTVVENAEAIIQE